MAIIEVLKQGEVDGSDIKYKKNAAKPKIKSADKEVSLNSLNQKATYAFDFGIENKNPEMVMDANYHFGGFCTENDH